jgi:endonuclease-3
MTLKERYKSLIEYFEANMPNPETELGYSNPYELLVAVILSAQCTDKRVNMLRQNYLSVFRTPQVFLDLTLTRSLNI